MVFQHPQCEILNNRPAQTCNRTPAPGLPQNCQNTYTSIYLYNSIYIYIFIFISLLLPSGQGSARGSPAHGAPISLSPSLSLSLSLSLSISMYIWSGVWRSHPPPHPPMVWSGRGAGPGRSQRGVGVCGEGGWVGCCCQGSQKGQELQSHKPCNNVGRVPEPVY